MRSLARMTALLLMIAVVAVTGCSNDTPVGSGSPSPPLAATSSHTHDHPTVGPHGGDLVELGSEEYHAEIVHDEQAGAVTLYVLDSGATQQIPIAAAEVTINAKHDGKPVQFKLSASPDAGDPQEQSSRFVSTDGKLAQCLDDASAAPRLVITISGKSYRGAITHAHDHGGHDHGDHAH